MVMKIRFRNYGHTKMIIFSYRHKIKVVVIPKKSCSLKNGVEELINDPFVIDSSGKITLPLILTSTSFYKKKHPIRYFFGHLKNKIFKGD